MAHTHFTRDDRIFLAKLIREGLSVRSIARILGFHPSSVYRELQRGQVPKLGKTSTGYSITKAEKHKKEARQDTKPTSNTASSAKPRLRYCSISSANTIAQIRLDKP